MPFPISRDLARGPKQTDATTIRVVNWLLTFVAIVIVAMVARISFAEWKWLTATEQQLVEWGRATPDIAFAAAVFIALCFAAILIFEALRIKDYFARHAGERMERWARLADPKYLPKLESDLRASRFQVVTTIAQIGGGAALLVGIYFTYQNLIATREGQVTDRFIRAVEQLGAVDDKGDPKPEIRLGGVYGLRRIAQDSREDYQPIRRILADYIRMNSPWPPKGGETTLSDTASTPIPQTLTSSNTPANRNSAPLASAPTPIPNATPSPNLEPRADIQAALAFLVHPIYKFEHTPSEPVDLHAADLTGAALDGAHLEHATLEHANLEHANLDGASLDGASLEHATLDGASLDGASLHEASLDDAYLGGASLVNANLHSASLVDANLGGASLDGALLDGAHLEHANLEHANLDGASLDGASLHEASLDDAYLGGVDLHAANGLLCAQIAKALGDFTTNLPPDLKHCRPVSWN
jgi:uncharacterized protein YjbI with pentapeptide repeats